MDHIKYIKSYLKESISVKNKILSDDKLLQLISIAADRIIQCFQQGNKFLIAGNGGSAADSQHIAAEFVSRFYFDRPGLPAMALTTDTSMMTAIGNDYGFDNLFARQIQAQGVKGDVFVGISTSGNSANVIKAVSAAKGKGLFTIALCGEGGVLRDLVDLAICVPTNSTPNIQECHICIGHIICAIVEERIFGGLRA